MKLAYKAYDGLGKAVSGVVDAGDTRAAMELLRGKGLYVAEVTASAATARKEPSRHTRQLSCTRRLRSVAWFSRQLYVLTSSGTQLVDGLHALERQTRPGPWRDVISSLRTRVEEGSSLAHAMEPHEGYFDPIYRSLVAAGESSGHLVEMFDRLAAAKQKQLKVRNAVVGALIYPCLLLTVGLTVFALMLLFVIPRFAELFESLNVPLPVSTEVLVAVSAMFRRYWWLVALLCAGLVGSLAAYLHTPRGRYVRDIAILRLPCVGRIARSFSTARIVSLLGVLLQAHIPMLEALRLVQHSAGNVRYQELVSKAQECVTRGEPMSAAFTDATLIDPSVQEAIRSGEASGALDRLLLNISTFLDEENEVILRSLTSIIEPVILIVMGLLVGLIAICMFMPLFDLTAMTQGGGAV